MSGYQKILVRFGILAVLVVGARMLTPPPTLAFDCCLDCAHQWEQCRLTCEGQFGCEELCAQEEMDCFSGCGPPCG